MIDKQTLSVETSRIQIGKFDVFFLKGRFLALEYEEKPTK